jgi:anti-sigma factor RsiW
MPSLLSHHPEDGILLRYVDGELPRRKLRQVQRHLQACWQCRTEIKELESMVASCVRYRKNVLQALLPDPPNPWPDLYREFARIDSSAIGGFQSVAKQLVAQLVANLGSAGVRRWGAAAAVALVMVCAVWYQFRDAPSVQAAVLLKRAVLAAEAQSTPARRVQIRTRTQTFTRTAGARMPAVLQARFEAARYDSDDPLSARAYRAWHDRAPAKKDEVTTIPDPSSPALSCYRIHTVATEGEVADASLVLRTGDLRPVAGRLEFRDREWVELTDITDATTRDDGASVAAHVELPMRPAVPSRPAATSGPASISDELQVFAALHEIGADLGDPVEIELSEGRVIVAGVGINAQRQQQIHGLLDPMPKVTVRFSEPAPGHAVPAETPATAATSPTPPGPLQARIEQQLGGQAEFEKFSSQVLDRNESMMARAYALRRLAENFPADARFSAADRDVLRTIARGHAQALASDLTTLDRAMSPLLVALGGSPAPRKASAADSWQPAAQELARASHRLEVLISVMLGATPANTPGDRVPSDLLQTIAEVRADVEACLHLLTQ